MPIYYTIRYPLPNVHRVPPSLMYIRYPSLMYIGYPLPNVHRVPPSPMYTGDPPP